MNPKNSTGRAGASANRLMVMAAVVVTAALLFASSFVPTARVWGASVWAYQDVWVRIILAMVLIGAAALILWRTPHNQSSKSRSRGSTLEHNSIVLVLALMVVSAFVFSVFRTETHFLGDGWFVLDSLASNNPLIRYRNFGESLVHIWVMDMLAQSGKPAALMSYRIVSVSAGVLHAGLVALLAPIMVGNRTQGWLFALGMMSGGYALLHFGYVENYSLFGLAVAAFTYAGVLVSMGRIGRWWIVAALLPAIFFHAMGLALVPVSLVVLISGSALSRRLASLSTVVKAALLGAGTLVLIGVIFALLQRSSFLRMALVPLQTDPLVLEGYSMFSPGHFADIVNLIFLLVPSILVFAVAIMSMGGKRLLRDPRLRFLTMATLVALAAAFAFEAKIGMPRDWDLFSFVGYPLMAMSLLAMLSFSNREQGNRMVMVSIIIGVLCLAPRVVTATSPALGVQQFLDYSEIDVRKNSTGMFVLQKYYRERGNPKTNEIRQLSRERFPEEAIYQKAIAAFQRSQSDSAMKFARQALALNPRMPAVWSIVGGLYMSGGMYDSAAMAMEICNGLNPDVSTILTNLGRVYLQLKRYDEAESALLKAIELDRTYVVPIPELVRLYDERNNHDRYMYWLEKAVYLQGAKGEWAMALGEAYLRMGEVRDAGNALSRALSIGADSARIAELVLEYPELASYMRR